MEDTNNLGFKTSRARFCDLNIGTSLTISSGNVKLNVSSYIKFQLIDCMKEKHSSKKSLHLLFNYFVQFMSTFVMYICLHTGTNQGCTKKHPKKKLLPRP